jgi:hypothetical protein
VTDDEIRLMKTTFDAHAVFVRRMLRDIAGWKDTVELERIARL